MRKLLLFIGFLLAVNYGYAQGADICFVHSATSGNITNYWTAIDHPALNNNPAAKVFITNSLNGDGSVNYNNKTTGVFYHSSNKWVIYNEDNSAMQISASFNVYVAGTGAQTVTAVAPGGQWYFVIDDPLLNDKPNLHPVITRVYDSATGFLDYNYGVYYPTANKWGVLCEDDTVNIPAGAIFNVLVAPSDVGYNTDVSYVHTATAANQYATHSTLLDHPLLNAHPEATFVATHMFHVGELIDRTFTTYYVDSLEKWILYAEGTPYTFSGEDFHIVVSLPLPPNNVCADATPLTVGINFGDHDVEGTLLGSDGASFGSVWFRVDVPVTGDLTIETAQASGSPMQDTWIAAYSGNCGALVFIEADDNGGTGNFAKLNLSGLTPGETIYILIEEDAQSTDPTGSFLISAYDPTLSVAEAIIDGFSMYPNPVENKLNLFADNTIDAVSVYNLLGQEVLQTIPSTTQVEIDMSSFATGSYIIKVQAGDQIGSYNLIKQ